MGTIVGFGECVIDFIPQGEKDSCTLYQACPGGSVANLCVVAAQMGENSIFIGGVGDDPFGYMLRDTLARYGIDSGGMILMKDYGTSLTFVHIHGEGREYSFANQPSAEKMVNICQVDLARIKTADVLYVSSNATVGNASHATQNELLKFAKAHGIIISYDVNYRANNYSSPENALDNLRAPLAFADVVKATEEELMFITGANGQEGANKLIESGIKCVLITHGRDGASYYLRNASNRILSKAVKVIDPVGAGDCFLGAFLARMLKTNGFSAFDEVLVKNAVAFGNKVAGISVSRMGAMSGVPTLAEVEYDSASHAV